MQEIFFQPESEIACALRCILSAGAIFIGCCLFYHAWRTWMGR